MICGRSPDDVLKEVGIPSDFDRLIDLLKDPNVRDLLISKEELEEKTIRAMVRRLKAAQKLDLYRIWKPFRPLSR